MSKDNSKMYFKFLKELIEYTSMKHELPTTSVFSKYLVDRGWPQKAVSLQNYLSSSFKNCKESNKCLIKLSLGREPEGSFWNELKSNPEVVANCNKIADSGPVTSSSSSSNKKNMEICAQFERTFPYAVNHTDAELQSKIDAFMEMASAFKEYLNLRRNHGVDEYMKLRDKYLSSKNLFNEFSDAPSFVEFCIEQEITCSDIETYLSGFSTISFKTFCSVLSLR